MLRSEATKFWQIANWIDPYGNPEIDSKAIIDSLEEEDYDESLKNLQTYITDNYETVEDLLNAQPLITLLAELFELRRKELSK